MTSQGMTILGAISAMLSFALMGLPDGTPVFVNVVIGALNAGLAFYLGKTNTGTKP